MSSGILIWSYHWWKIQEHIEFELPVIMYQCVNNLGPSFIKDIMDYTWTKIHWDWLLKELIKLTAFIYYTEYFCDPLTFTKPY